MDAPITNTTTETLRFAFGETTLGAIVVAQSERGVAAILIGDDQDRLRRNLREAFPTAKLINGQEDLATVVDKAVALVNAPHVKTDLVLDLRGSALELAVWEALQAIPAGETRSYGAIAKGLPIVATAQDVGAACAANRVAIAVPCHRVVKADGSISGYRWGVPRKRRLINMEGVA